MNLGTYSSIYWLNLTKFPSVQLKLPPPLSKSKAKGLILMNSAAFSLNSAVQLKLPPPPLAKSKAKG